MATAAVSRHIVNSIRYRNASSIAAVCIFCILSTMSPASVCATSRSAPTCTSSSQESVVLNFFIHDDLDEPGSASAITVVPGLPTVNGKPSKNLFGAIVVLDDSITTGAETSSTEIARGRGFYIFDYLATGGTALEFVITVIFNSESDYDGSTLTLRGYDRISDDYRELAVTGGTGKFRLARGWAGLTTNNLVRGAAILNTTCYVYYGCYYGSDDSSGLNRGLSVGLPIALTFSVGACVFLAVMVMRYRADRRRVGSREGFAPL